MHFVAGIIFWHDFAIFSHFFFLQEISSKFPEWEKKSHSGFFSFQALKFLFRTCGPFRDFQTVLSDRFLNYCGHKIHYTYSRSQSVSLKSFIIKTLCQALVYASVFWSLPWFSLPTRRKLFAPKLSSRDGNMFKYLVRTQSNSTEAATLSSLD